MTSKFICSCCGRRIARCRCYITAETFGWEMRPEWEEARRLAEGNGAVDE